MSPFASRRDALSALAGFLVVPALSAAAAAGTSSDLGPACLWAVKHRAYMDVAAHQEDWSDERLDEECAKVRAITDRALHEPSENLRTLHGKASLCLDQFLADAQPSSDPAMNRPLDELEMLVVTVLREAIKLCA